jgi:N-acetylglutamate synthase-like GNAT family acetyltransferase
MEIEIIRKAETNDLHQILNIAKSCYDEKEYNDYVEKEIKAYTDKQSLYDIDFYVYQIGEQIVSFAGVGQSMFLYDVYELRLGTTLSKHRNKGILSKLVEHRLSEIKTKLEGRKGMIQVSTKHYNIYSKFGFYEIFENSWNY